VDDLREQFMSLATRHGGDLATAEAWWREVEARYSEVHRRYHTLGHIRELLGLLPDGGDDVLAAVWFHDVIYDRRGSNEERSVDVAREALADLQFPRDIIERVTQMILATRDHDPRDLPVEAQAFLDADLAILGSSAERYRAYAGAIRFEYSWVPDETFREARDGVLRRFLAKPRLYLTDAMRAPSRSRRGRTSRGSCEGFPMSRKRGLRIVHRHGVPPGLDSKRRGRLDRLLARRDAVSGVVG
jgi:predicted metal-dependent HD superfamily phosphohydrolase